MWASCGSRRPSAIMTLERIRGLLLPLNFAKYKYTRRMSLSLANHTQQPRNRRHAYRTTVCTA